MNESYAARSDSPLETFERIMDAKTIVMNDDQVVFSVS